MRIVADMCSMRKEGLEKSRYLKFFLAVLDG
jgi:hypothetical protein